MVCKIGTATGTATTGDVIIIPATQLRPDGTNVNNPLPGFKNDDPLANSLEGMGISTKVSSDLENLAILGGSDEYLGTMTHISNANVAFATTVQAGTELKGTNYASGPPVVNGGYQALPGGIQDAAYNDNAADTNGSGGNKYDIVAKTANLWIVGAAKLEALLQWQMGTLADWSDP